MLLADNIYAGGPGMKNSFAAQVGVVILTTLMLMWPATLNRGPVLYPDTVSYVDNAADTIYGARNAIFGDPDAAASGAAAAANGKLGTPEYTNSGRSLTYGLLGFAGWRIGGFATAALMQAAWVALALILILKQFGIIRPRNQLAVAALMTMFTSLGFFAGTLLPDVFAGVGIAALAMLVVFGARLNGWSRLFWVVTLAFACATHNAILLTVIASMVVVALLGRKGDRAGYRLATSGLALAAIVTVVSIPAIERFTGAEVAQAPFLLARSISDGPAARVLSEDCPAAGYASCRFVPYFPMTEGDVLWSSIGRQTLPGELPFLGWARLPPAEQFAIGGEANDIVLEAVKRYPMEQMVASLRNSAEQLVYVDIRKFGWPLIYNQASSITENTIFASEGEYYKTTRISEGSFPLGQLSDLWQAIYFATAASIVVMLLFAKRLGGPIDANTRRFVTTLIVGVVINAAVNGSLSSIVGRYQSRLSWLVLLSAILIGHALRRAKAPPEPLASPI